MLQSEQVRRANRALDAANFFLADVQGGLGPYLAIYLLTAQKWNEATIGVVMSIATAAGLLAQTPAGMLVDATRAKRGLIAAAALLVTGASVLLPWLTGFFPVAISQAVAQAAGAVFAPAITAVTPGIFGHAAFTRRNGRNQSFNHIGTGRCQGGRVGPQAALSRRLRHSADPRRALRAERQSVLARRRAIARRHRRRHLRCDLSSHRRRPHARDRAFQRRAGRDPDGAGRRCCRFRPRSQASS
jgi:hypothetical protein